MPFFDALATGWIIPVAATVRLEVRDNGQTVEAGWEFDRVMVSYHGAHQAAGNPREPRPPCKFHNYWTIRTPPGWSCLFVPPLNRPNAAFEVLAGIVDTDTYASLIHFPFFASATDGLYVIEKGTPMAQVIPFRREDTDIEAVIRAETQQEAELRERVFGTRSPARAGTVRKPELTGSDVRPWGRSPGTTPSAALRLKKNRFHFRRIAQMGRSA